MKFFTNVLGIALMVNTLKMTSFPSLLGHILWYFLFHFGVHSSISCFIIKFSANVLRITVTVTTLKKNVHIISPSTGGYFSTYVWLMFLYFLRFINIFSWNFLEMFLVLLWWLLYKNKVHIVFPTAGCHFGTILACAPSFFEDQ